ncbi:YbaL family putative K(+) efflux transporter [Sphingomonas sp. Leaf25]|uniref:YbaL family putative K(+) efflux transporter n=1 Tax=Sphingomonas sp. Leaf25 TaxID=1735692 RepID=UPI0006FF2184|nr:YbaL family putative K(+) efflux transporter [Sphingomonas sp. Leaf25]KQN07308.1 cation:proton antiport protein [Sphingomonas sp. Leaf25]
MPHYTPLIGTIVLALVVAFFMGALAHRLRVSPIAGYLMAGVLIGPFTPGVVADSGIATELAEIGVILLMFGVGLHFSLKDLMSVWRIAVPGAIVQIAAATLMGLGLATWLGWPLVAGLCFGLALSVASTVVLLRALEGRSLVQTERGRIAVGWLIVEDLAMVVALVLLPVVAAALDPDKAVAMPAILWSIATTLVKVGGFVALMLIVGRRAIPWALHWVVHTGSRELFRLAVLAIALGVAFGSALAFDVSFALGAFFAGMILGETELSRRAAQETLPLRDAFAVLFFVSVGMLADPKVLIEQPLPLLATVGIIVIGKSAAAWVIVRAFGHPNRTAATVAASLAQIGEFSFILAGLGTKLGILPAEARDLILGGAILSILVNPVLFAMVAGRGTAPQDPSRQETEREEAREEAREDHVVVIGAGRVGRIIAKGCRDAGRAFVIVEDQRDTAHTAVSEGWSVVVGNALDDRVLRDAGVPRATKLLIAIPGGFEAGAIAARARALNPDLYVLSRAHSVDEVAYLKRHGVDEVVLGEEELARTMLRRAGEQRAATG